jgi:hypothetical protein
MCVPVIACETRICRKDSQYQALLLGPVTGRSSIKSCQSNKNTSFGKKVGGVLREKSLKYQSMILNELLFQACLVLRPTLFTMLRSSSILFPPVVR